MVVKQLSNQSELGWIEPIVLIKHNSFKKNVPTSASFSFIFVFSNKHRYNQFLQQINVKKFPSSIGCQDSNWRPLENGSPPITTRQGSYPLSKILCVSLSQPLRIWSHDLTCNPSITGHGSSWRFYREFSFQTYLAIAQWIRLRLPFRRPGFESQACHLRFFIYSICAIFVMWKERK